MTITYTHTGYRPRVGYQHRGRDFNHVEPIAGKVHAVTSIDKQASHAVAACGETIPLEAETLHGDPISGHIRTAGEMKVTCSRCRALLGLVVWRVQILSSNFGRVWYTTRGGVFESKLEAEKRLAELQAQYPHARFRVRRF